MLRRSSQSRAFTLIEIIVVAALISLLSGIALFSINEMYIRNIRKVSLAETYQLATALSMAENDLIFYPRLNYLRSPKELMFADLGTETAFNETSFNTVPSNPDSMLPGIDYWGMYEFDHAAKLRALANWAGPYMGVSQARQQSNRGAQSGLVKMRLPDLFGVNVNGRDISLVDWPADPFGNPYLLYQFKAKIDETANANIPLFLDSPTDDPSWRNIVVSYGRNQVPGGNDSTPQDFRRDILKPGALYVEGDEYGDEADFTLKVIGNDKNRSVIPADLLLTNEPQEVVDQNVNSQHYLVLRSLSLATADPANHDPDTGQVGVIDDGSDDILLEF